MTNTVTFLLSQLTDPEKFSFYREVCREIPKLEETKTRTLEEILASDSLAPASIKHSPTPIQGIIKFHTQMPIYLSS